MYVDPVPEFKRYVGDVIAREIKGQYAFEVGSIVGLPRSRVAALRNGRFERFSVETLIRVAAKLRLVVLISVVRRRIR